MVRLRAVLGTSATTDAYGGFQFPENLIASIPDRVKSGDLPLGVRHDPRENLVYQIVDAFLERDEHGHLMAVAMLEIPDSEWERIGGANLSGMSLSLTVPEFESPGTEFVSLAADAHWFAVDELGEAFDALSKSGMATEVSRLYNFALEPEAQILVQFVVAQLTPFTLGLLTNFAYDGLRRLFVRRKASVSKIHIKFEDASGQSASAYLETDSPEVLERALKNLPRALSKGLSHLEFNSDDDQWKG